MTAATIRDIISLLNNEYGIVGTYDSGRMLDLTTTFSEANLSPLSTAGRGDISFCNKQGDAAIKAILQSDASFIFCDKALNNEPGFLHWDEQTYKMLIFVENPRLWFMRMLKHFNQTFQAMDYVKIDPSSHVHPTCSFNGEVVIGKRCVVDPYVVFGEDGFGYERNERGQFEKFPHLGGVRIGNDVDIGAHTVIDRATLPDEFTTLGERCKLDNFVHVAHNVNVGDDTIIVSHCNLGGSVKIGRQCWLAMSVCIKNSVKIGNRCVLGNRANVVTDIPDNSVVIKDNEIIGKVDEKEKWRRLVGPPIS